MHVRFRQTLGCAWLAWSITSPIPGQGSHEVERAGDVLQIALPAVAGLSTLALRDFVGTRQFVVALVVSTGASHLLKRVLNTSRPDGGRWGFPSAHTSAAFLGSGFVQMRYGMRYAWPMHIAAAFVGYSRVAANKHWVIDVLGGAALSLMTCWIFVRRRTPTPGIPDSGSRSTLMFFLFGM